MGWFWAMLMSLLLSGCAQFAQWPFLAHAAPVSSRPGHYDFNWRLSGDRAVAPMQVFDDGRQMWLQFAPDAPVPAIFSRSGQGDSPLSYDRNGPYVVLQGVWPLLVLRGGRLQSFVERIDDAPDTAPSHIVPTKKQTTPADAPVPSSTHATTGPVGDSSNSVHEPLKPVGIAPSAGAAQAATSEEKPSAENEIAEFVPGTLVQSSQAPLPVYEVSPSDQNIRLALVRWATTAGWTFGAAHWTVDVDIPIVGSARFDTDFKQAVRALLASTELAATPLQACFYSNKVLRVIAYAQACDRTASRTGQS